MKRNWEINIKDPIKGRKDKPRTNGLTMVLDKGKGINGLKDLLEVSGSYIDFIKFSFGTSFVYSQKLVKQKLDLIKKENIEIYPGGTLFEVAVAQNQINEYLFRAKQLGFTAIEISNGTISYGENFRSEMINKANALGFKVLTEVGKKDKQYSLSLKEMVKQIEKDISNGASQVIIEARESGKDISIYKKDGSVDLKMFKGITNSLTEYGNKLIWEAPLKKQQIFLINKLGPNVNLGNIKSEEVIALECLRRGLRGDTFKNTLNDQEYNQKSSSII